MVEKYKTPGAKKAFSDMFGKPKIYQIDDHGIEDQKAKKDKSRPADKAPVSEGINGEWTKERSRREEENIKAVKKGYGDFRTTIGKNTKEKMKEIASSMNEEQLKESLADLKLMYAESIPEIVDEIKELSATLIDYYMDQERTWSEENVAPSPGMYLDWKGLYRGLEDLRDRMLCAAPDEAVGIEGTEDMNEEETLIETYSAGALKLSDGSTYNLTSKEAKALNELMSSTKEKSRISKRITQSKDDLKSMLDFAGTL